MIRHLKSHAAPNSWTFLRKVTKFVTCPNPGAHTLARMQPLSLLLKQLGFAKTTKEAKKITNAKLILVDGRVRKDHHHGVGFMDSVQIGDDVFVRVSIDTKGRLTIKDIDKKESGTKISRIMGKKNIAKGKLQLSLLGGRNILSDNKDIKVGDSVVIEVPSQKIVTHFKLEKGNTVFMLGGRHIGTTGTVVSIDGTKIRVKGKDDEFDTRKDLTFIVGKDKPVVTL